MTSVDTNVVVRLLTQDDPKQAAALALAVQGIELADAMHLCGRPPGAVFVSFDRSFVRRASRAGAVGVSGMPARE